MTERMYREYLISLKDTIFKTLYLYEERNPYIRDYIDSIISFELYGAVSEIEHLPHSIWCAKTINTLRGIDRQLITMSDPDEADNHKRIRKQILMMMNLIDKQIDQLKGE